MGPHHGVVLKKLERLGNLKALEVDRERFLVDGVKVEHTSFCVRHAVNTWPELVVALMRCAQLICPAWQMVLASERLMAGIGDVVSGYHEAYACPVAGLRSVHWDVNQSQVYRRISWLNGQPNRW